MAREKAFTFHYLQFKPFDILLPIDWHQDPFSNTDWQWALHCFRWLEQMQSNCENNLPAIEKLITILISWFDEFSGTSEMRIFPNYVWHDHSTSLRSIFLSRFYVYCIDKAKYFPYAFIQRLKCVLYEHGFLLCQPDFYAKNTNHGIFNAHALLWLGKTLEDKIFTQIGALRLKNEYEFAFTEEGVHKEGSPGYHLYVMQAFSDIVKDFPHIFAGDASFSLRLDNGLLYLSHIIRPDRKFPIIGDTVQNINPTLDGQFFQSLSSWPYFQYAMTNGQRGRKPPFNKVFPRSGYAIFRDDDFHLVFKAGSSSTYHYHQDEGSFVLYAAAEDWFIDSGLLDYRIQTYERKLVSGRSGHNVPASPGMRYDSYTKWHIDNWSENRTPYVASSNEVIIGIKLYRCITLYNKKFIIHDRIGRTDSTFVDKEIHLLFHVPYDKTIDIEDNIILIRSNQNILTMNFNSKSFKKAYVTGGFNKDMFNASIVSYKQYKWTPSHLIHAVLDFNDNDIESSVTILYP